MKSIQESKIVWHDIKDGDKPDDDVVVLLTIVSGRDGIPESSVVTGWYHSQDNWWEFSCEYDESYSIVIAWAKFPDTYKE